MTDRVWQQWADRIRKWGLENVVAALLEAAGPLTILGAQVVYLAQPVLSAFLQDRYLSALVVLLEDAEQSRMFIGYLREGASQ
jgi:hypothetical protein